MGNGTTACKDVRTGRLCSEVKYGVCLIRLLSEACEEYSHLTERALSNEVLVLSKSTLLLAWFMGCGHRPGPWIGL